MLTVRPKLSGAVVVVVVVVGRSCLRSNVAVTKWSSSITTSHEPSPEQSWFQLSKTQPSAG